MQIDISRLDLREWLRCLLIFFVLSILLKAAYSGLSSLFSLQMWQAAFGIHALIAIYLLKVFSVPWIWRQWYLSPSFYLAIILPVLSALAVFSSSGFVGLQRAFVWPASHYFWLLVVPIAEELVFRFGIGQIFKKRVGYLWGTYLSVLFFAWVHVLASSQNWRNIDLALPLGPLLLGITCEIIWQSSKSITAPILLHISANMTALVFNYGDPSWFNWLGKLYIGSY